MTSHRFSLRRLAAAAIGVALVSGLVVAAPAQAGSLPSDCQTLFWRHAADNLYYGKQSGGSFTPRRLAATDFGAPGVTPRAMTYLRTTSSGQQQFLAVMPDGSLWQALVPGDGSPAVTKRLSTTWGSIRDLAAGSSGYVYALTTRGGLLRYTVSGTGVVKSAGTVATSGWGGIRYLSWSGDGLYNGANVDAFLAVTSTGELREYLLRTSDRRWNGFTLRASGWGGMDRVVVGGCKSSLSRPIIGLAPNGTVWGYLDRNGFNLRGGDIVGAGLYGTSFTGLKFN